MDKNKTIRLYCMGQTAQKIPFGGVCPVQKREMIGEIFYSEGVDSKLLEHLENQTVTPFAEIMHHVFVSVFTPTEDELPLITVAENRVNVSFPGELHDIVQGADAVRPLFQEIPIQNQNVITAESGFLQKAFQIGEIAVNV